MTTESKLTDDEVTWIKSYKTAVVDAFNARFEENSERFQHGQRLVGRFSEAVEAVLQHARAKFHAVDEVHNELCIAHRLLSNSDPTFDRLEYEPTLTGTAKSIDFRASVEGGQTVYVDAKTIKPTPRDRWEQYERAVKEGWFPDNVQVLLSNEWLGGELWHNMFAARSRMLEYTVELEQKIADAGLAGDDTAFVLALCGEGFHWHQDELEDFVSFYRTGHHRVDDPFSQAETKYMQDQGICFSRTISHFACMRRTQGDIDPKRLNWNVQPPSVSAFQ